MSTFKCTRLEFRRHASDFFKMLKECQTLEQANNGYKCLGLFYLGITDPTEEATEEVIILRLATKKLMEFEINLISEN